MKKSDKQEMTINDLAKQMAEGFAGAKLYTDDLAIMVADGFAHTQGQINDLSNKVSSLDGKVSSLDNRTSSLESKMDGLATDLQDFRREFNDFRSEVRSEFRTLWREVEQINNRLDRIEKNKAEEIVLISSDLLVLKAKVASLEQKVNKFKLAS